MKRFIYTLAVLLLCFGMGARADNVLTITGGNGAPDEEVTVSFALTNSDAVSALQVSIPLDEELTLVSGSLTKSARLVNHDASASANNGVLTVMVYSTQMAMIAAGEGELFTLKLKMGSQPKNITLTPSTLTLTGSSGTVEATSQAGTVSIRCAKAQYSTMTVDYGAVPIRSSYQRTVTVTNIGNEPLEVTALTFSDATTFSSTTTLPFTVAAGASAPINVTYAPTVRGAITENVKVTCNSISKLNTIQLAAQPFAVNELHVDNVSGVSDTEVEVVLRMNNMDPIVGFQAQFTMPSALEYVAGSFGASPDPSQGGESRWADHTGGATLQGNTLTILVYSPTGQPFKGDDGVLGSFRVKLVGRYGVTLTPTVAQLTAVLDGVSTDVLSAKYGGNITIQSPQINANSSLAFGRVPVTGDVTQTYTIQNYGNAPLTISRIVFADEGYTISDELPIEIGSWANRTLTITRTDKTEGDFATTMNIYSNDPDLRMKSVSVSGNIYAPNFLTVTADDSYQNDDVLVHVSLSNYDAIRGFQFDITATEEYIINATDIRKTERGQGLNVSTNRVDETTLRVVAYLMDGEIAPGEGELMTLRLTPTEEQTLGQHQVTVKNVKLGTADLENKNAGEAIQQAAYTATELVAGDVNHDGSVSVIDVISTINHILQDAPTVFSRKAADVNGDGDISVVDVIGIIDIILNQ